MTPELDRACIWASTKLRMLSNDNSDLLRELLELSISFILINYSLWRRLLTDFNTKDLTRFGGCDDRANFSQALRG